MSTSADESSAIHRALVETRRFVPRFHYELLVCGTAGHKIVGLSGPEAPAAVDGLVIRDMHGMRWHRCLRCDSWLPIELVEERRGVVPGEAPRVRQPLDRDTINLPARGRPLRDRVILRVIAVDRGINMLVLAALAVLVLSFGAHQQQLRHRFNQIASALQPGTSESAVHSHGLLHSIRPGAARELRPAAPCGRPARALRIDRGR